MNRVLYISAVLMLIVLFPITAAGEDAAIGVPEIKIEGTVIEEAELTADVTVSGDAINKVILSIQFCSDGMCYMPVDVAMNDLGDGKYQGVYSDFESGYDYYQYQIVVEDGTSGLNSTEYVKLDGLPGYGTANGDNETGDDDTGDDDTTGDGNDKEKEDSPGFTLMMVLTAVLLLAFFVRRRQ